LSHDFVSRQTSHDPLSHDFVSRQSSHDVNYKLTILHRVDLHHRQQPVIQQRTISIGIPLGHDRDSRSKFLKPEPVYEKAKSFSQLKARIPYHIRNDRKHKRVRALVLLLFMLVIVITDSDTTDSRSTIVPVPKRLQQRSSTNLT
jgi:hypothetical protein